jgi:hypothetical protein
VFHREKMKKDMRAKGKIMHSSERKLCVQRQEAKEAGAKDAAIIKLRSAYTQ